MAALGVVIPMERKPCLAAYRSPFLPGFLIQILLCLLFYKNIFLLLSLIWSREIEGSNPIWWIHRIWWAKLDNCFNLLVSGIITVSTLFTLSRVADAVSDQANSSTYQCEDAGSYYHDVDGLKGAALMKKLNSIVSPHRSLPYKEVGARNFWKENFCSIIYHVGLQHLGVGCAQDSWCSWYW